MKTRIIRIAACALAVLLCFGAAVFATNYLEITALLSPEITIKLNGAEQTMKDAAGKIVYPISYEGTTYVPIRAVSNMLGIDVNWDEATSTVLLGSTGEEVDFIENFTPYASNGATFYYDGKYYNILIFNYSDEQWFSTGSNKYDHFIAMATPWNCDATDAYYDLAGKYQTFTFTAYCEENTIIKFYGDNDKLIDKVDIIGKALPSTHTISLDNTQQFKIRITGDRHQCKCFIVDAYVK